MVKASPTLIDHDDGDGDDDGGDGDDGDGDDGDDDDNCSLVETSPHLSSSN